MMAAFCACCGAEIGPKAEACPVCGTPQHGMVPRSENGVAAIAEQGYPAVIEGDASETKGVGEKFQRGACCRI